MKGSGRSHGIIVHNNYDTTITVRNINDDKNMPKSIKRHLHGGVIDSLRWPTCTWRPLSSNPVKRLVYPWERARPEISSTTMTLIDHQIRLKLQRIQEKQNKVHNEHHLNSELVIVADY